MVAQCHVFFQAGHETSSSVKTFCLYELALHQDIQDRLHKEIQAVIQKHGELTYRAVQEMEYLDMVVSGKLYFSSHNLIVCWQWEMCMVYLIQNFSFPRDFT